MNYDRLPVNTLVGADKETLRRIVEGREIDEDRIFCYRLTSLLQKILWLFGRGQERKYRRLLADKPLGYDPFFILGHWRSGTTFVHNIFAQDPHFAHTTTYQTCFPHLMMRWQWLFKFFMNLAIPERRPTDYMPLSVDQPQEEEFALQNTCPITYYNFWVFPKSMREYCDRFLTMKKATREETEEFKEQFQKLVKISIWNTENLHPEGYKYDRLQYLSKNPPHTGKVKILTEMFPEARFLHLRRNPYTVFESSRAFISETMVPLQWNCITMEELEQNILYAYRELYFAYEEQKKYIPEGHLMEVKFEDIEHNPYETIKSIYEKLSLPNWEEAEPQIRKYIESQRRYKKNSYSYEPRTIKLVNEAIGDLIPQMGYDLIKENNNN
ncbi:MAG: sulfotransferase [Bacteroidaceae bacterium]|nr:sulfotransferase [Bacteroidaceae bacterium]